MLYWNDQLLFLIRLLGYHQKWYLLYRQDLKHFWLFHLLLLKNYWLVLLFVNNCLNKFCLSFPRAYFRVWFFFLQEKIPSSRKFFCFVTYKEILYFGWQRRSTTTFNRASFQFFDWVLHNWCFWVQGIVSLWFSQVWGICDVWMRERDHQCNSRPKSDQIRSQGSDQISMTQECVLW